MPECETAIRSKRLEQGLESKKRGQARGHILRLDSLGRVLGKLAAKVISAFARSIRVTYTQKPLGRSWTARTQIAACPQGGRPRAASSSSWGRQRSPVASKWSRATQISVSAFGVSELSNFRISEFGMLS